MSDYSFDLIVRKGNTVLNTGQITGFDNTPSINDSGLVAIVGKFDSLESILVSDGSSTIKNLSRSFASRFHSGIEINNYNQVVATDWGFSQDFSLFSAIRLWDGNNPGSLKRVIGTGAFPTFSEDFENILPFASLNNQFGTDGVIDQVAFVADPIGSVNTALETFAGGGDDGFSSW